MADVESMAMAAQAVRRTSPRRTYMRSVGLLMDGQFRICLARQLGEGGMLILSSEELPIGQRVAVSFFLPQSIAIVARGEIRYVQDKKIQDRFSYGIQFRDLSFELKRGIRHFVASKSESEAEQDRLGRKNG